MKFEIKKLVGDYLKSDISDFNTFIETVMASGFSSDVRPENKIDPTVLEDEKEEDND